MKFYDIQLADIVIFHTRGESRRGYWLITDIVEDEGGVNGQSGKSFYGIEAGDSKPTYITWAIAPDSMPEEFYEVWRDGEQIFPTLRVKL